MSIKNSSDTIGNQSAVPQPTAPPRAPSVTIIVKANIFGCKCLDNSFREEHFRRIHSVAKSARHLRHAGLYQIDSNEAIYLKFVIGNF
jgi:hypothetical protein